VCSSDLFTLKVIVVIKPFEVLIPGEGTPPLKLITPEVFEYDGVPSQILKIDCPIVGVTTCNLSGGKTKSASTVLTLLPPVFKYNESVNVLPTTNEPEAGDKNKEAPD
jgi:hypothetical protein